MRLVVKPGESTNENEKWGFLLIDAKNAFNEGNRILMLWTVRHTWPSGARYVFNNYRHWAILIIRSEDGFALFLFSKEGVTQGDPLAMVAYALLVLPLILKLKALYPDVDQPWYADDAGAGAYFHDIKAYFVKLQELGPPGLLPQTFQKYPCCSPEQLSCRQGILQRP